MSEKIYHIELDDCATPAFVTFGKDYYGTMNDVEEFISKFKPGERQELVEAFREYKQGNFNVEIPVGFWKSKMLEEVKVYGKKQMSYGEYKWEHTNIWGFPYYMKCDALQSSHYWIKDGKKLCRIIKVKFTNLQYKNTIGEYKEIGMIWGFPHIIAFGRYNTLMVVEKQFETVKELKENMRLFNCVSDMDFNAFCNDIFADS